MKCKNCKEKMTSIDDSGSFTTNTQSWDHYMCPKCLTEVHSTKNGNKITDEWTINNNFYHRTCEELKKINKNNKALGD